jgi:hypothetical protein
MPEKGHYGFGYLSIILPRKQNLPIAFKSVMKIPLYRITIVLKF